MFDSITKNPQMISRKQIQKNIQTQNFRDNEDSSVIELLEGLESTKHYGFLEVGSGLCRFVKKIYHQFPNISITCVEINEDLAQIAKDEGCEVHNINFLENNLDSNSYDIVHCSHVIEHFPYPEIRVVLDELLRITKIDGYLIIRSPLMWEHFYDDIDHVRPYPPQGIINYLNNPQQQYVGKNKVEVVSLWYRNSPIAHHPIDHTNWIYCVIPLRRLYNKHILPQRNRLLERLWNKYRWPATKPNGYVMILKKKQ